ncbi:MAG: alpha amylase N-terminal ig-like domain-containing protein, partial [Oscillospiraceae bacterium]|nr:alpha amylase N-terminal ig-like domain-containing protein [Oscillospiraceae bacterium]
MNQAAIIHRPTSDYIYPSSRNTLEFQLITARDDVDEVELLYWMRYETNPAGIRRQLLNASLKDTLRDYYRASICTGQIAAYIRYCFHLRSDSSELWLGANGVQETEPAMNGNFFEFLWPNPTDGFSEPAWRSRQVYYQIFPERFKSGNPSITPPGAAAWGSPPTRENFMGGDLAGIANRLDYIRELGVTCLYLTPIFRSPSNHKYDTVDYFEVDPAFGTKEDFRRLVDGVHARGMRIILDGVFNHCGYWWDKFQDVVQNGETSAYRDWFFIHSYPVNAEQMNYDCVGHYKWMPKLNLANPDVLNYFISVGRYWLQEFGIDGWRLDVA